MNPEHVTKLAAYFNEHTDAQMDNGVTGILQTGSGHVQRDAAEIAIGKLNQILQTHFPNAKAAFIGLGGQSTSYPPQGGLKGDLLLGYSENESYPAYGTVAINLAALKERAPYLTLQSEARLEEGRSSNKGLAA